MSDEADGFIEKARRSLEAARVLHEKGFHEDSLSRAYYAMFYAAEAALLTEGVTASTHSGVHAMFGKHFIKTGMLPEELSAHLGQVFEARQSADYAAAEKAPAETREALEKAEGFVAAVEAHLHGERNGSDDA